jgi:hypothetical protein
MAGIDPSIPLGVQNLKLQLPDPIEQSTAALRINALLGQQDLQGLQINEARRKSDAEQRIQTLLGTNPNATSRDVMGIDVQTGLKLREMETKAALDQSTIAKNTAEVPKFQQEALASADKQYRDAWGTVANPQQAAQLITAGFNHPLLGPKLAMSGTLEDHLARIPNDPQTFGQWVQHITLGGAKYAELNKPSIHMQNTGAATNALSFPGLGGAPSVVASAPMVPTPGELMTAATARTGQGITLRGQNLADARAAQTLEAGRWTNDLERGIQVNSATGETRPITEAGAPLGQKGKPLTEAQGKAAGMLFRAQNANTVINAMEDAGVNNRGIVKQAAGGIPLVGGALEAGINTLPGFAGGPSANQQKVEQARRSFVNAALRVESGAAISQSEFQNAEKQYFQQPGDSPEVRAQKRADRDAELEALRLQAGPTPKAVAIRPALGAKGRVDPAQLSDEELMRELRKK